MSAASDSSSAQELPFPRIVSSAGTSMTTRSARAERIASEFAQPAPSLLVDRHGRAHRDLRVSLTDRCNLRCSYCMPAEGLAWLPAPTLLTTGEMVRIGQLLVGLGITEVRLTGGEPLLRPDAADIVHAFSSLGVEVSLTTNGLRLPALASSLADAGLSRVNVSLDTLVRERFTTITHRDRLPDVLAGLAAAKAAGLSPIKINTVLVPGVNDDEAPALLEWALENDFRLRFIEQMPLDAQGAWSRELMVTAEQILESLSSRFSLVELPLRGSAPAEEWWVNGGPATVGIVASVTRPFCGSCDRLRLTADGQLRNCLFAREESDLRTPIRDGASDAELTDRILACVAGKRPGHGIDEPGFLQPPRPMSAIGG